MVTTSRPRTPTIEPMAGVIVGPAHGVVCAMADTAKSMSTSICQDIPSLIEQTRFLNTGSCCMRRSAPARIRVIGVRSRLIGAAGTELTSIISMVSHQTTGERIWCRVARAVTSVALRRGIVSIGEQRLMHKSVLEFVYRTLDRDAVADRTVLDVGAANVNGSARPYVSTLDPKRYIGVDTQLGVGVDYAVDCERLSDELGGQWDILLSTEMLEHVRDWRACAWEMPQVCVPGGLLLWTTRSPGFKYHAHPEDHWRYTREDMASILRALDLDPVLVEDDPDECGVFVLARKPQSWQPNREALDSIEVARVQRYPTKRVLQNATPGEPATLMVAFPLYQSVSTEFFCNWLQMDKTHLGGHVAVQGSMYLPQKMETLCDEAFRVCPDLDRIVIMEQDMIAPLDAFNRIAAYGDEYDIVCSTFFKHESPHHVMAWMQVDKPRFSPLTRTMVRTMVESPGLYPVDGGAMGLTSIHRRVFEEWDWSVPMWVPTPPMVGHDLHFCNEARKQGFGIYLDSGLGCGHLTLVPIGYGDQQTALADDEPETWQEAFARGKTPVPL